MEKKKLRMHLRDNYADISGMSIKHFKPRLLSVPPPCLAQPQDQWGGVPGTRLWWRGALSSAMYLCSLWHKDTHASLKSRDGADKCRSVPQGHFRNDVEACPAGHTNMNRMVLCWPRGSAIPTPARGQGMPQGPSLKGSNQDSTQKACWRHDKHDFTNNKTVHTHIYIYTTSFCSIPAAFCCPQCQSWKGPSEN